MLYYMILNGVDWHWVHCLTLFGVDQHQTYVNTLNTDQKLPDVTGSAGTGKSFVIHFLLKEFERKRESYLLLAPTGVAAQNVGKNTIHLALKIHSTEGGFQTHLRKISKK